MPSKGLPSWRTLTRAVVGALLVAAVGGGGGAAYAQATGSALAPVLTQLTPSVVSAGVPAQIQVAGRNLDGMNLLLLDGQASTFPPGDATGFQFILPPQPAGPIEVQVATADGGLSNVLTLEVVATPVVSTLVPDHVPIAGARVLIAGSGFTTAREVLIDGVPVAFAPQTDTGITFTAPSGSDGQIAQISVVTDGGISNALPLTYVGPPVADRLSDQYSPAGGGELTLTGRGLSTAVAVVVDGQDVDFSVVNDTTLTFRTPVHEVALVEVTVETVGGVTQPLTFTYLPTPALHSLQGNVASTDGGDAITITGLYLAQATEVFLDGTEVPFTQVSDTQVAFTAPPHAPGIVNVTVSTAVGGPSNPLPLTYQSTPRPEPDAPVILQHPKDVTVVRGQLATFTVAAEGDDLQYRWFSRVGADATYAEIPTATNPVYEVTAESRMDGWQYVVEISNDAGAVWSEHATLSVPVLRITAQPEDVQVAPGQDATFRVEAEGAQLSYQWYARTGPQGMFVPLPNATGASLVVAANAVVHGRQYRVVVADGIDEIVSSTVTLRLGTGSSAALAATGTNLSPLAAVGAAGMAIVVGLVVLRRRNASRSN